MPWGYWCIKMRYELQRSDGKRHVTEDRKAIIAGVIGWIDFAKKGEKLTITVLDEYTSVEIKPHFGRVVITKEDMAINVIHKPVSSILKRIDRDESILKDID